MSDPLKSFGLSILSRVMESMGGEWSALSVEHRGNVAQIAMDYGSLVLRASFEDVEKELEEVSAAISCWEFIAEDVVRRALLDAVEVGLVAAGKVAMSAVMP